jgi:predicted GNAT superfamily acetyltransferase
MSYWELRKRYKLKILETPTAMQAVERLQNIVWHSSETEVVPAHMLLAAIYNGGFLIGAYDLQSQDESINDSQECAESTLIDTHLVGFVFSFPGIYRTPDGPRLKHNSHMLAVHPDYRNQGIGFALKRAQWQMVRRQGIDRITWTYDPLLSKNAYVNIARLGATCNTYMREAYGEMRDGLNAGDLSDRLMVDWWVDSRRVFRRLSSQARTHLNLAHFLSAETSILNPTHMGENGLPYPTEVNDLSDRLTDETYIQEHPIVMVEIPSNFSQIKRQNTDLVIKWRFQTRSLFETLFQSGYLITDFVHLAGQMPRSFYVLSHGEATL